MQEIKLEIKPFCENFEQLDCVLKINPNFAGFFGKPLKFFPKDEFSKNIQQICWIFLTNLNLLKT